MVAEVGRDLRVDDGFNRQQIVLSMSNEFFFRPHRPAWIPGQNIQKHAAVHQHLHKALAAELFQLPHERYCQFWSTELHSQADLARRLSFETDWMWQAAGAADR
jgi:hypothetical protein